MLGCLIIFTPPISENCEIIKMCLQRKHFYQEEALGAQEMWNNNQGVLMLKGDCICDTEASVLTPMSDTGSSMSKGRVLSVETSIGFPSGLHCSKQHDREMKRAHRI